MIYLFFLGFYYTTLLIFLLSLIISSCTHLTCFLNIWVLQGFTLILVTFSRLLLRNSTILKFWNIYMLIIHECISPSHSVLHFYLGGSRYLNPNMSNTELLSFHSKMIPLTILCIPGNHTPTIQLPVVRHPRLILNLFSPFWSCPSPSLVKYTFKLISYFFTSSNNF